MLGESSPQFPSSNLNSDPDRAIVAADMSGLGTKRSDHKYTESGKMVGKTDSGQNALFGQPDMLQGGHNNVSGNGGHELRGVCVCVRVYVYLCECMCL